MDFGRTSHSGGETAMITSSHNGSAEKVRVVEIYYDKPWSSLVSFTKSEVSKPENKSKIEGYLKNIKKEGDGAFKDFLRKDIEKKDRTQIESEKKIVDALRKNFPEYESIFKIWEDVKKGAEAEAPGSAVQSTTESAAPSSGKDAESKPLDSNTPPATGSAAPSSGKDVESKPLDSNTPPATGSATPSSGKDAESKPLDSNTPPATGSATPSSGKTPNKNQVGVEDFLGASLGFFIFFVFLSSLGIFLQWDTLITISLSILAVCTIILVITFFMWLYKNRKM